MSAPRTFFPETGKKSRGERGAARFAWGKTAVVAVVFFLSGNEGLSAGGVGRLSPVHSGASGRAVRTSGLRAFEKGGAECRFCRRACRLFNSGGATLKRKGFESRAVSSSGSVQGTPEKVCGNAAVFRQRGKVGLACFSGRGAGVAFLHRHVFCGKRSVSFFRFRLLRNIVSVSSL